MKRKTFEQQLLPILKERFRNDESDVKRHLKEASTPAAQTLIKYMRQWEYKSRNIALSRLIECRRWNDKGEFVLERDFKGKEYPTKVPLWMAWEWYVYGDQRQEVMPSFTFDYVKQLPDNMTEDWQEEVKGLFRDINRRPLSEFKLIAIGKAVKSLGANNPYAVAQWERNVNDFKKAQEAINAYVKDRKGWDYLTTENLQNPKHSKEMSKVLGDILAKADEIKEPAYKAIREQDRKMHIRQDATGARNDIKTLKGFFQKYSEPVPNALILVEGIVGDVESRNVGAKV